jgi:thiamine biosynthesis lipoprotein
MDDRHRLTLRYPSRREVIALGVGAFVVAAVPFARSRRARLVRRTVPTMGTLGEIGVVHRDPQYAHAAIDAAIEQLQMVERRMTWFTTTSEVGRVNQRAAVDAVPVSRPTLEVLEEALRWAESSHGAFDPCLGRATALWDVGHRSMPPAADAVRQLAGRRLYRALDLDHRADGGRIRFTDADASLDLGGIGKGYAVDRAVAALREWGITNGLVNVGGDLYALGTSEDGDPWNVGIRSPWEPDRVAEKLEVGDGAVATSGDYLQYFQHGGGRFHHLLDPATGAPRQARIHSVTVRADACMTADAAATAVFGMESPAATRLLRRAAPDAQLVSAI